MSDSVSMQEMQWSNIHDAAFDIVTCDDVTVKCKLNFRVKSLWDNGALSFGESEKVVQSIPVAGKPVKPNLVHPSKVARRSMHNEAGRLVLLHAIAHIEFNAINLAWDAIYRFRDMPKAYYDDWISVGDDEARHFKMIENCLKQRDMEYGDYDAHNGLWDMAVATESDVLLRMALVPRVLEARGLDVSPGMIQKLEQVGDQEAADLLKVIYQDEIGHVAVGSRWFKHLCAQREEQPELKFKEVIGQYISGKLRGPFNYEAREKAGFTQEELDALSILG